MKKFSFIMIAIIAITLGTSTVETYAGTAKVENTKTIENTVETTKGTQKGINKKRTTKEDVKKQSGDTKKTVTKETKANEAVTKDTKTKKVNETKIKEAKGTKKKNEGKKNEKIKSNTKADKSEKKTDNKKSKENNKNDKKNKKNKKTKNTKTDEIIVKKAPESDDMIEVIGAEINTDDIVEIDASVIDVDTAQESGVLDLDNPQSSTTQVSQMLELNGPPVSMTPVENHDVLNYLNSQELAAFNAYKSSFVDAMIVGGEDTIVYSGNMPDSSYDKISEVIGDELFPYVNPGLNYYYYDKDKDGLTDIVCNPTVLLSYYNTNLNYKSTVQSWARQLINQSMSERDAYYTILNWICSRLTYSYGTYEAKYGVESGYGNCMVYSYMLKDMLNAVGIDCKICCGSAEGIPHQWNQVKIDGSWYFADPCWSDNNNSNVYGLSGGLWCTHLLWK